MEPIKTLPANRRTHALLQAFGYWALFLLFLFLTGSFISPQFPDSWERYIYGLFGTGWAFLVTWIVLKTDKSRFHSIHLVWDKKSAARFVYGLLIGFLVFAGILCPLLAFSDLTIAWNTTPFTFTEFLFYFSILPLAWMEEIAFRALPFERLNKHFGFLPAQLIVAIVFALYHVMGGWSIIAAFTGPAIWSLVFGLATYRSGGIAMATGIHAALNIAQPLVGMKTDTYQSLWVLSFAHGESQAALAKTDGIGMMLQALILLGSLALSIFYFRRETRKQH